MNNFVFLLYRFLVYPFAYLIFQAGSWFGGEKWRTLCREKNRGEFRLSGLSESEIRTRRPFWIHAASGEIEYARPVIRALKARFPEVPIVVTYGSVSAIRILSRLDHVDAWGPVPWEFATSVRGFLSRFQPRALLVARTDLWPVLMNESRAAGIPSLLFAATFAGNSSRLKGLARRLTEKSLRQLDAIHVVSEADRANVAALAESSRVSVAGDTRFDQVLHRLANPAPLPEDLKPSRRPVLVAGSTWPEDEAVLLPAITGTEWNLLLAPHEVDEKRLSKLEEHLRGFGLESQRLSNGGPWSKRVLILDRIGVLAELYAWGDLAFVGGSFRKQVHSVMEPLAAGLRVIVGPCHLNNREALDFQSEIVSGKPAVLTIQDEGSLRSVLGDSSWLSGREELRSAVSRRTGATEKVIDWCSRMT